MPFGTIHAAGITHEEAANGIHNSGQNYWIGNTSRDQYIGIFFGLSVAYELLGQADMQTTIQSLVTRMLDFLISRAWTVLMPNLTPSTTFSIRPDEQLGMLQVGRQVNPSQFAPIYKKFAVASAALAIAPVALESQDDRDSYFKFNLDAINLFDLVRLENDPGLNAAYRSAYGLFRDATKSHLNAHFNMIDRALNGPDSNRDAQTVLFLYQWLERPSRDVYVDLTGQFPTCGSADQSCNPIPVDLRVTNDFLWQRSPFQLTGGGSGLIETAGIDYILPYWMARYYGVEASGQAADLP